MGIAGNMSRILSAAPPPEPPETIPYDPSAYTVTEVQEYVTAHPGERGNILAMEQNGKNRVTLTDWLSATP